jgi:dihydrodipicolinate synthase/N-acetylneuraminate lyase
MSMLNMASEELRLPMTPMDESKKAVLEQTLKDYGLLK